MTTTLPVPLRGYVWIRYGSNGKQLALVVLDTLGDVLYVRKYRANSGRFTKRTKISRSAVLHQAPRGAADLPIIARAESERTRLTATGERP